MAPPSHTQSVSLPLHQEGKLHLAEANQPFAVGPPNGLAERSRPDPDLTLLALGPERLTAAVVAGVRLCRRNDMLIFRHFHRSRHQCGLPKVAIKLNKFTDQFVADDDLLLGR